jgi:hypothetical protein
MGEEAEELLRHRFEIVNVWRPIRGPLRDAPLAVCDATTVAFTDFVPSDLVYRDRTGEIYRVSYNPAHRWFYVPEMQPDEAILIKCYDPNSVANPYRPLCHPLQPNSITNPCSPAGGHTVRITPYGTGIGVYGDRLPAAPSVSHRRQLPRASGCGSRVSSGLRRK